jgi:hypothetical protein
MVVSSQFSFLVVGNSIDTSRTTRVDAITTRQQRCNQ